jgi:hypothetical protein
MKKIFTIVHQQTWSSHITIARCHKHQQTAFLPRLCRMSKVNALPLKIQGSEKICIKGGDAQEQPNKESFLQPCHGNSS